MRQIQVLARGGLPTTAGRGRGRKQQQEIAAAGGSRSVAVVVIGAIISCRRLRLEGCRNGCGAVPLLSAALVLRLPLAQAWLRLASVCGRARSVASCSRACGLAGGGLSLLLPLPTWLMLSAPGVGAEHRVRLASSESARALVRRALALARKLAAS